MDKPTPCVTNRFRRSRQALAAFLLLGGSAITGITSPLAAHDHAASNESAACSAVAAPPSELASGCMPLEATALTPVEDWIYEDCWEDTHGDPLLCEDERACLAVSRQGSPAAAADESPPAPAASAAEAPAAEASAAEAPATEALAAAPSPAEANEPEAAGDVQSDDAGKPVARVPALGLRLENLVSWTAARHTWHSPLLSPAAATPAEPIGILLAGDAAPAADAPAAEVPVADAPVADALAADSLAGDSADGEQAAPQSVAAEEIAVAEAADAEVDVVELIETVVEVDEASEAETAVAEASATEPPQFGNAGLVGGAPIVVTLPEAYLPYDLSPEDLIALRMYPIDGPQRSYLPQSSYLGARRTGVYGPLDHVAFAQRWRQVTEPAVTIATAPAEVAAEVAEVAEVAPPESVAAAAAIDPQEVDVRWVALIASVTEMLHPDNPWRHRLAPQQLAQDVALWLDGGSQAVETLAADLALRMSAPKSLAQVDALGPQSELADPATLLAQAELQPPRRAAEEAVGPVLIGDQGRVPQVELACQAAIEVVRAQAARAAAAGQIAVTPPAKAEAARGAAAEGASDALARAAAVATVCDQAASSLERLAMVLRRAGDTLVRQAQADAGGERLLR